MTPFPYSIPVTGNNFHGRQKLIEQFINQVEDGNHIFIQGDPRVGKTSLVIETVRRMNRRLLHVDLTEAKNVDAICKRILRAVLALEYHGSRFDDLMKELAYLRPSLTINSITGRPAIHFDPQIQLQADAIPDAFALMGTLERPVVFLDGFQDVIRIEDSPKEVLPLLCEAMQKPPGIPHVFAVRTGNRANEIDASFKKASYKLALNVTIGPLPQETFIHHLAGQFQSTGRQIAPQMLKKVFEVTDGLTGDVQQFCEALWTLSREGETIGEERIPEALDLIFSREQKFYEIILSRLPASYVRMLQALAKIGGKHPTSRGVPFVGKPTQYVVGHAGPQTDGRTENCLP